MEKNVILKNVVSGDIIKAVEADGRLYERECIDTELDATLFEVIRYGSSLTHEELTASFEEEETILAQSYGFNSFEDMVSTILDNQFDAAVEENEQDFYAREAGWTSKKDMDEDLEFAF